MPNPRLHKPEDGRLLLLEQVDTLNEEVKTLALNLALYLAKAKADGSKSGFLDRLEPKFIRLVNGTVKIVQELTIVLNAGRNLERHLYEIPSDESGRDQLEMRLENILHQCSSVLSSLMRERDAGG